MTTKLQKFASDNKGMTLMDLAMAMLIIGLILAPILQSYQQWSKSKSSGQSKVTVSDANKYISDFYFLEDRYPCPADPALGPGDAEYGVENCLDTDNGNDMLVGSVPFVTLKLPESRSLDGWQNKLTYAVTKPLTDALTFTPSGGLLTIEEYVVDAQGCTTDVAVSSTTSHYVFVSHGEDGIGAYNRDGNLVQQCPDLGDWTRQSENCLHDNNTFFTGACAYNPIEGPDVYDDIVQPQNSIPDRMWTFSKNDEDDIYSNYNYVGINIDVTEVDFGTDVNLEVLGNIRADNDSGDIEKNGNSSAGEICDGDGENCFSPAIIGGVDPSMDCSNSDVNSGMSGIANARASCEVTYVPGISGECPPGQYMIGIDSGGGIICAE